MENRLENVTEDAPGGMKLIARTLPVFWVKRIYRIRLRDRSTTHSQSMEPLLQMIAAVRQSLMRA